MSPPLRRWRGRTTARTVGALVLVGVLGSCAGHGADPRAPSATPTPGTSSPLVQPPLEVPALALPAVEPWRAGPGEVRPEVKTAAARLLEAVGTWDDGGTTTDLLARGEASGLLAEGADEETLAPLLAALAAPGVTTATTEVVYPQYGGLTPEAASVMAVLRQELRDADGGVRTRGTTLDVRLAPSPDGAWRVTGVEPPLPRPAGGAPSTAAQAVLDSARIRLPAAAADDLRSGLVADEVSTALLRLADDHVLDVAVLRAGHPVEVFGTERTSNHARGRAVDLWRLDDRLVADPDVQDLAVTVMRAAGAAGATEVGGPVDVDGGPGGGFFSDDLHQDHLHLGFTEGREPIGP